MVGTEFLNGQGLGNQLFCYITARCIAKKNGYAFGTAGLENFGYNIHSQKGMYFMDLELGEQIKDVSPYKHYDEKEERIFIKNSAHDMLHGCYIAGTDEEMMHVEDDTLLYGNMQAEDYFREYKEEIKEWMKVKPEYEVYDCQKDNLCIINVRGGEYESSTELFLRRKYWLDAIKQMKKIRSDMEFLIVTDDVRAAEKILPGIKAMHGGLHEDYCRIKNAKYLILSNSSFAFFPAYTSETLEYAIAPKYWARHNVSDGYWASEQNIYDEFVYMDRKGKLFTPEECRQELAAYRAKPHKKGKQASADSFVVKYLVFRARVVYYSRKLKMKLLHILHMDKKYGMQAN